jgi:hypothetical protein
MVNRARRTADISVQAMQNSVIEPRTMAGIGDQRPMAREKTPTKSAEVKIRPRSFRPFQPSLDAARQTMTAVQIPRSTAKLADVNWLR